MRSEWPGGTEMPEPPSGAAGRSHEPLRLGFAGTPAFAATALQALMAAGRAPVLVLTQPDRPAGRGMKLQASSVKQEALAQGLPVLQPRSLRLDGRWPEDAQAARDALLAAELDVLVVAAYGLILPPWVLQAPRHGCLNIHASLLPRWRGAAPIHRAIQAGDAQTGITIMQMDEGLDTGAMLLVEPEPIHADDTTARLHDRLAQRGGRLIVQALDDLQAGRLRPRPQPEAGVCYAHKIDKAEAAVDWSRPAIEIERTVRAFDPAPGAHFSWQDQPVKLWRCAVDTTAVPPGTAPGTILHGVGNGLCVACGSGSLRLLEWQLPGGRRQGEAAIWQAAAGRGMVEGQRLS